jgi:hypothetical protein
MSGRSPFWGRLALEAATIVISILLAFSINAWWASREERARLAQQLATVRSELQANRVALESRAADGGRALLAAQELVRASGPNLAPLPRDSLGMLIHRTFNLGAAELSSSALDVMLAAGAFGLGSEPELHATLLRLRAEYDRHRANAAIFTEIRESVIAYLVTIMPVANVSHNTGAHENTDFPVRVSAVLSDPKFESHIGNLAVRIRLLKEGLEDLVAATDSVLPRLKR